MLLMDVNIFVYAYREDMAEHFKYKKLLESIINSNSNFAYSTLVLSGFLRIVTHPKIFEIPSSHEHAARFVKQVVSAENAINISAKERHWSIFIDLVSKYKATGNSIPDLFHAALAIESGCEWVTTDKGFKMIKELKLIDPMQNFLK